MSMTRTANYDQPLTPEDAFQVTLLVNAEMTKNVLLQFNQGDTKVAVRRRKLLKKFDFLIEELNQTYKGHVPQRLKPRYDNYYMTCEASMNTLLKGYRATLEA